MKTQFVSEKKVQYIFETIKNRAFQKVEKGNFEQAIHLIEIAAQWGYYYTYKYSDDTLELLLRKIAGEIKKEISLQKQQKRNREEKRIVFVCNRMVDNCELIQQYTRALASSGLSVLLIVINRKSTIGCENILHELQNAYNITIKWVEDTPYYMDTAKQIASFIITYQPTRILAHVWPWDVRPIVGILASKQCPCYNINFNDHSFWIGTSMLDYLIEFRPYGSTISIEKRGISPQQLLYLPYYPILSTNIPFQGFPFDHHGKIVIFTGGSSYKMLGKENLYFFHLDSILEDNVNAVVLIAGDLSTEVRRKIAEMKNKDRVYTIPFRRDIASLFLNSDIFYATYPMSGGLMSQYAAVLGKPIIAFAKRKYALDEMDGIINFHNDNPIARHSIAEIRAYARRLCCDEGYRLLEGDRLEKCIIKRTEFEKIFIEMMKGNHSPATLKHIEIDYEGVKDFYLDYSNSYSNGHLLWLASKLRLKSIIYFPQFTYKFVVIVVKKIIQKVWLMR